MTLQKKSILIPTPGQTEQEYLGRSLMEKRIAVCTEQKGFSLEKALTVAGKFNYQMPVVANHSVLVKNIERFLSHSFKPDLG